MLRKYYTILWQSFSDDHVANIELLSRHLSVTKGFHDDVVSKTDPDAANKLILNGVIRWLKKDDEIMEFCKVMRILATNRRHAKEVLQFQIGALTQSVALVLLFILCVVNSLLYTAIFTMFSM